MPIPPPDDYERLLVDFQGTVQELQIELDRANNAEQERNFFKRLATKNLNDRLHVAGELDEVRHEMSALRGALHQGEYQLNLLKEEIVRLQELIKLKDETIVSTTPTWDGRL